MTPANFPPLTAVLFTALLAAACGDDPCDAVARGRRLAGSGATDCGVAVSLAESAAATNCALRAKEDGKPYSVAYQLMGRDSTTTQVYVEAGRDRWLVTSDDFTEGINGNPKVDQQKCTSIEKSTDSDGRTWLECQVPSAAETVCR